MTAAHKQRTSTADAKALARDQQRRIPPQKTFTSLVSNLPKVLFVTCVGENANFYSTGQKPNGTARRQRIIIIKSHYYSSQGV